MAKARSRPATAVVVVAAAFIAWAIRHAALIATSTPSGDGQRSIRAYEVVRAAFARGEGFPRWDIFRCGGAPFLADKDTPLLTSTLFALMHVHGDVALRVVGALYTFVGIVGGYAWGRRSIGLGRVSSLFLGAIFMSSGFVATHGLSRLGWMPIALVPWCLVTVRLGRDDRRVALGAGALLAWMALEGAFAPLAITLIAIVCCEAPSLFSSKQLASSLTSIGIAIATFALLAAPKLVPMLLAAAPQNPIDRDHLEPVQLIAMLLDRDEPSAFPRSLNWDEYASYVGPFVLGMAIAGVGTALILRRWRFDALVVLVVGCLLTRGAFASHAPYVEIARIFPADWMRVPSRLIVLAALGVAGAAAIALDAGFTFVSGKPWLGAALLAVTFFAVRDPVSSVQLVHAAMLKSPALPKVDPAAVTYKLVPPIDADHYAPLPIRNLGTTTCETTRSLPDLPKLRVDAQPPAWPERADVGTVHSALIAANTIVLATSMRESGPVIVDTRFDEGWTSDHAVVSRSPDGLLSVTVPSGERRTELRYRTKGFVLGATLGALGVVLVVALLITETRRRATHRPRAPAFA